MAIMKELKGLKGNWQAVCQICRFRSNLGPIEYIDKTAITHCREHKHNVDICAAPVRRRKGQTKRLIQYLKGE
jgi:hypothetical protein